MGSSSSKQSNTLPQGQTITQTGLPSYFQPYVMDVLQRGQEASYQPYTPYKDQRIAGFTPGQIQAQEGVLGLQTPGQFGTATQFATQAGQMGLGAASQYMPGQFTTPQVSPSMVRAPQMNAAQTGFAPNLQAFQMEGPERVAAERATTGSFIQPGTASQYMSPYMQNVVDVQKQAAIEDARKAQLGANLGAARQGTYGGARQLLAQTEREKALGQQLGQIQATGSQAAYDAAQRQFEAEQGRGLQAQQFNVQSQLQAQLANQQAMQQKAQQDLAARLGVQELGTQTGLQTALANLSSQQQANVQNLAAELQTQGMNQEQALRAALANQQSSLEAQRLQEQSRQYGAGLGLEGAGMGLDAARTLGGLGSAQQQAEIQRLGAISGAGAEQQALTQQQMDLAYQDFLRQQQYPMSQLQQYAGLMSGVPSPGSSQVQTTYAQPSSLAGQLIGAAGGLGSAYMMSRAGVDRYSARGGEIKNYNVGGLVAFAGGGDTPEPYTAPQSPKGIAQAYGGNKQAIQQAMQSGVVDPTSGLMAAMLIDKMRAPSGVAPQGTIADQVFGSPTGATPAQGQGLGAVPLQQAQQAPQPMQQGLNTPDIATAADGGIIGYASGDVARFNGMYGSEVGLGTPFTRDVEKLGADISNFKDDWRSSSALQTLKQKLKSKYLQDTSLGSYLFKSTPEGQYEGSMTKQYAIENMSPGELINQAIAEGVITSADAEAQGLNKYREQLDARIRPEELGMELSNQPQPTGTPLPPSSPVSPAVTDRLEEKQPGQPEQQGLPTPSVYGIYSPSEMEPFSKLTASSMPVPAVRNPKEILKELEALAPYDTKARDALIAAMDSKADPSMEFWKALTPGFARMAEAASQPGATLLSSVAAGAGVTANKAAELAGLRAEQARQNLSAKFEIEQAENARRSALRQEALVAQGQDKEAAREAEKFNMQAALDVDKFNAQAEQQQKQINAEQRNTFYRDAMQEANANHRLAQELITREEISEADRKARLEELNLKHEQARALLKESAEIDRIAGLDQANREYLIDLLATDNPYGGLIREVLLDEDIPATEKGPKITQLIEAARKQANIVVGSNSNTGTFKGFEDK